MCSPQGREAPGAQTRAKYANIAATFGREVGAAGRRPCLVASG